MSLDTADAHLVVTSPSSGQALTEIGLTSLADVDAKVEAARRAYPVWQHKSLDERVAILRRIGDAIDHEAESLAVIESTNVGKPLGESRAEVALAARTFRYYAGAVDKLYGITVPSSANALHYTVRQPFGVVAAIVPWNFPLVLASWKIAPALATGNAVLVKPAALTPLSAVRLAEICHECGVPDDAVQVLVGRGASLGRALVDHPTVRKISFTGSTEVGREIFQRAAQHFKRLTLELGGKSANVMFADADLQVAIPEAVASAFANAGQDCCARSRILVEATVYDEVVDRVGRAIRAIRVGDPLDVETDMGPLVSREQRAGVLDHIACAVADGATLVCGGREIDRPGFYMEPTLLTDVTSGMRVMREEVFGPVVAIQPFANEEEAIEMANATEYGLSGSVWTRHSGRAVRVAHALEAGVVSINSSASVHISAPFGGVKSSGLGRELGMAALEAYTETKTVYQAL